METEKTYAFCALLSRMKYINRWGLMRAARPESLSEHTAEAAMLAHTLALIAKEELGQSDVRPGEVALAALYHDASEILTGDMPTPVKYKNEALKTAYKQLERESAEVLAALAPPALQPQLLPLLCGTALSAEEAVLLKAADRLCALIKCLEEEAAGNSEFASAKAQQLRLLEEMDCAAANYFIRHFLPCYKKTLDELTGGF
ncbi:5'-deoxynucleotidase [Ruminococcaceae bacterium OttesenSCG-928-O06]|nr:5'-deoxynucleotidase [Ruminococcaceae bacterium OttesenSCG-928-O06]